MRARNPQTSWTPAGTADLERRSAVTSAGLVRRDGVFTWLAGPDAEVEVPGIDGTVLPGQSIATLDVPSLALATDAPNASFDLAVGVSPSRRRGEPPSLEVRIELAGVGADGAPRTSTHYLLHPEGQRPLTAVGVALGVERLLGLRGAAVPPGIHTPESLVGPAYAVERMVEIGATFKACERRNSGAAGGTENYHPAPWQPRAGDRFSPRGRTTFLGGTRRSWRRHSSQTTDRCAAPW